MEECCNRKKKRSDEEKRLYINRLSRVEGQIRGISKMLSEDAYCIDILTQISAAEAALSAISRGILEDHIKSCVVSDIKADKEGTVEELIKTVGRLIK